MHSDVCVYGGTSAGIIAAITVASMKRSVVLVEPGRHLGGMSSGGLGWTDFGNKAAIGGRSREFYRRLGKIYGKDEVWSFEPRRAEQVFKDWLAEAGVRVLLEHRLAEVATHEGRIDRAMFERVPADASNAPGDAARVIEHVAVEASIWIDATYEGDLLARAGVKYATGRESVATYDEPLNGIRGKTPAHQFQVPVDPFVKPGDETSGLLPLIGNGDGGHPGDGDARVQSYNFRLCLTKNPENRIPISAPAGFDPARFVILARHIDGLANAGKKLTPHSFLKIDAVPNGKTDINNNGAVSTDFIGGSWAYPEADYAKRRQIWLDHLRYTHELLHFLATSERVPAEIRRDIAEWGFCKDEFTDTGGWPHQMYIREARRMIGPYVVTQADCEHKRPPVEDSVGLGAYNMDSHNCQRVVQAGVVRNEGDVQVAPSGPYAIPYRAITPKAEECSNLLVPVCLSASHIAYGSIRMEPVFMVLGESAATAACLALDGNGKVQEIDTKKLTEQLETGKQVLRWKRQ